jgi:hypothetical protein
MAAPKLPKSVAKIFDNTLFKLGFMFMIGYLATKDPSTAIISSVALMVTLQTLSSYETAEKFSANVESPKSGTPKSETPKSRTPKSETPKSGTPKSKTPKSKTPKSITIALSPNRVDFVNECMKRADQHYGAAQKAMSEGNASLAEAHKNEAIKQEIKADSAVKVKQHIIMAEKAAAEGNQEKAKVHMKEATKQEVKVESLVKAEAHKQAAEVAKQNGDVKSVETHMKQAVKQEAKAEALIKAEVHKQEAVKALSEGKPNEAQKLVVAAEKLEQKVLSKQVVQEKPSSVPVPASPDMHAKVVSETPKSETPKSETPKSETPKSETPKSVKSTCNNNFSVTGYSGGDYASF